MVKIMQHYTIIAIIVGSFNVVNCFPSYKCFLQKNSLHQLFLPLQQQQSILDALVLSTNTYPTTAVAVEINIVTVMLSAISLIPIFIFAFNKMKESDDAKIKEHGPIDY